MSWLAASGLVGLLLACPSDSGPARVGEAFRLAPGESRRIERQEIRFVRVSSDSRCPVDVACITGGDASVELTVRTGDAELEITLHTGPDGRPNAIDLAEGRTLKLIALEPVPRSTTTTPPDAYRATLRVDDDSR